MHWTVTFSMLLTAVLSCAGAVICMDTILTSTAKTRQNVVQSIVACICILIVFGMFTLQITDGIKITRKGMTVYNATLQLEADDTIVTEP